MKFLIAYIAVVGYLLWRDCLNELFPKTPKTYKDLMNCESFRDDERLQKELRGNIDEVG